MSCVAGGSSGGIAQVTCVESGPRSIQVDREFGSFVYPKDDSWSGPGPTAVFKGDERLLDKDLDHVWSDRACTTRLTMTKL